MKFILLTASLLFLCSCMETKLPEESSCIFKLEKENIFVKTTKYKGGKFALFFAIDSMGLYDKKDYIEFKTGDYIRMFIDSDTIYVGSYLYLPTDKKDSLFTIKDVSRKIFQDTILLNRRKEAASTFVTIDTKEYTIIADTSFVKRGDIYGGW